MTKQDLKEINERVKRKMDKYEEMIMEYAPKHSLSEVDAFRDGINAGMKIMSEEK